MRRALVNAALVAASVAVSLGVAELALRVAGFSYASFWMPDDVAGARLRPGIEAWQGDEGGARVKINSRGLRDREHELPKPEGVYRIAVLGDSYAEALQVELEETFWFRLPAHLQGCGFPDGRRVEAINFGVSGYGTAQQLVTLRHRAWAYDPDMVLLAFFPGNDVRNNSRALEPQKLRPFFSFKGDGALLLDDGFRGDPRYAQTKELSASRAWLHELRLYQLLRRLRAGEFRFRPGKGIDEDALRPPADPAWEQAWRITEALIATMHEEAGLRGARFLVAVLSTPVAVFPDRAVRARTAADLGVEDLFYAERRIERLGEQRGFGVVALAPAMQRHADLTGVHLHGFPNTRLGFGHWNEAGHELAAALIARHLCKRRDL